MEREILTDLKLYRMKNGQKITKEFLRKKKKNESYSARSIECMVDSCGD